MPDNKDFTSTSQKFLEIHDIIDDVLILKNGSTALILTVNAMNFGLLAEEEQDAVIYAYASLLNSINYSIQIVIRSDTKDASSYLKILEERKEKADSEIKREWIDRYSQFVSNLIKERNVLDKKFFVIIPAGNLEMGLTPAQNLVSGFKESEIKGVDTNVILEKAHNLLEPRRDHLIAQFNRLGLYARQLKTQEIIRLFYTSYNPEASEGQKITKSQSYTTPLVQARIKGTYMVNATKPSPTNNGQTTTNQPTVQPPQPAQNTQPATQQPTAPQQNIPELKPLAQKQTTLQESPNLEQPPMTEKTAVEKPIAKTAKTSPSTPIATPPTPVATPPTPVAKSAPAAPSPTNPSLQQNLEIKQPVQQEAGTISKSPKAQLGPAQNQVPVEGSTNSSTNGSIKITSPEQNRQNQPADNEPTQNEPAANTTNTAETAKPAEKQVTTQNLVPDPEVAQNDINSSLQDLNSKG